MIQKKYNNAVSPIPWMIIASASAFYLWINPDNTQPNYYGAQLMFFGDINSYKINDTYGTLLIANTAAPTSPSSNVTNCIANGNTNLSGTMAGHYMARSFTQIGSSIPVAKHSDLVRGSILFGRGNVQFPNPIDNSIVLAPVWINEPNNNTYPIRGTMPGMWNICHTAPFSQFDTFTGSGNMAGKTFMAINVSNSSSSNQCQVAIEISNTW
jgi:hypothetical protein